MKKNEIVVIPNPIDTKLFSPQHEFRKTALSKRSLEILFVGRLQKLKGVHILSKAMPLVWAEFPDVNFLFVGKDGTAPDFKPG